MLDNLLGGRLRVGLLRGTPNEYLTYFDEPVGVQGGVQGGRALLDPAVLTEPEPFGWEGRYYRFRNISMWPQPVQRPHPRILLSANSADGAQFAGGTAATSASASRPPRRPPRTSTHYKAAAPRPAGSRQPTTSSTDSSASSRRTAIGRERR